MSDRKKSFYITTTLPYVNAEPHVGFAMELIRADIIARFKEAQGFEVFFNTGTDEHGQKLFEAADKVGKDVSDYVGEYSERFRALLPTLGIKNDIHFIRTTDSAHIAAAQEFWRRVQKNGFIYKKKYKAKYCVGCEEEKTDSELVNGRCAIHNNRDLEIIEEENYFFKFSEFGDDLLKFYKDHPDFVIPETRLHEMQEFVKRGLHDFSISRLKTKMSWGVPVPNDSEHVMYVWFDALVSYISTLGWPDNKENFERFWHDGTPLQYCGKDNTRFQAVMWQAMLMAAKLPQSAHVVVNGFIVSGGQKMSKSLGNVIDPTALVKEYGTDALRYYVARELSPFEDSDFTMEKFKESYNANLANGLGNLVSRTLKMTSQFEEPFITGGGVIDDTGLYLEYQKNLEIYNIKEASEKVWILISLADNLIQKEKPFTFIKTSPDIAKQTLHKISRILYNVSLMLEPLMPHSSETIRSLILKNKMPETPLFPRKD